MNEKSQLIGRLLKSRDSRASYIRGKISVLVSAQLHALRLKRQWTQKQFATEADMKQSRVSAMEQPGAVNFNLETLVRSAATFGVGLVVKFVPVSEMLRWENHFNQDSFDVNPISQDIEFISDGSSPPPNNLLDLNMLTAGYIGLTNVGGSGYDGRLNFTLTDYRHLILGDSQQIPLSQMTVTTGESSNKVDGSIIATTMQQPKELQEVTP